MTTATRRGQLPIEELARLPSFAFVTPSHAGDKIAFYWDKTGRFELYMLDLHSRAVTQVTDGQAPKGLRAGLTWTRDDAAIIYAKDQDGNELNKLFLLDRESGQVRQLTEDEHSQDYAGDVHPDNGRMAVMSNRAGQMNVHLLDIETRVWTQVTDFKAPAMAGKWSKDGQWLAFGSNESRDLRNQDGYLVRQDGGETKKVFSVKDGSKDGLGDWHPDGHRIAVTSDASGTSRPGILDLDNGDVRWFGAAGVDEFSGEFSESGEWLLTIRNEDSSLKPMLYRTADGTARELNLPPGMAASGGFVLNDTKLLIQHTAANRRPELLLYDLATDSYEVLLAAEYGSLDPANFVADEYVRYPTFDGQTVPAILYAPHDAGADGEKLPAIVHVHGGPTGQFFRGFDPYAQFLVASGFVVLCPNVRGSTGYGVTWRDCNLKDWGGGDLEDVAAGAAFLKSLPYVDPDRIGVFGGSYGGFMSFIAVVKKPDLFKVGVPWIGITDLHKLYDEDMEHFKYYLRQQLGDPQENYALWRDRSAIEHADKLKAKLLIMHGLNDPRCPITQARIFRERILANGKREGTGPDDDFEYHEFADEGHGPSGDIKGKIRTYRLVADFLQRRL